VTVSFKFEILLLDGIQQGVIFYSSSLEVYLYTTLTGLYLGFPLIYKNNAVLR